MIERYGYGRYMTDCGGTLAHEDRIGKLWRHKNSGARGDEISVVEVVNGTPEPDGSFKRYFLSVPPECQTATEAVAWTYGMTEKQYANLRGRT
jgi:hypothetical protein